MKKSLIRFLTLPLFAGLLSGCILYNGNPPKGKDSGGDNSGSDVEPSGGGSSGGGSSEGSGEQEPPVIGGQVTAYLVLGPTGLYEGKAGENVDAKFLENTITYTAAAGSVLPGKDKVTSTVTNSEFAGWITYEGTGAPVTYERMPSVAGTILYASFTGGSGSGGASGGGSSTPSTGLAIEYTIQGLPTWITDDGCMCFAWVWGGDEGNGNWKSLAYTSETSATFMAASNMTGMLFVRCAPGTTTPDWSLGKDSNDPGRIYNQTNDIPVQSGVTTYTCSDWKDFPINQ